MIDGMNYIKEIVEKLKDDVRNSICYSCPHCEMEMRTKLDESGELRFFIGCKYTWESGKCGFFSKTEM